MCCSSIRASLVLALAMGLPCTSCQDLFTSDPPIPIDLDPSTTTTTKSIVDTDYRFRLDPPGSDWRLMGESEIQKMAPDALAGAVHVQGLFGMVIIEPAPGADPKGLAQLVVDNMPLENKRVGPFVDAEYVGKQATRFSVSGTTSGLSFRYISYAFVHQNFFYQVMAGGISARVDPEGEIFEPFFKAFSLTPGQVRDRQSVRQVVDSSGVGWRVQGGVFESAVCGLRVEARGAWHLAVGSELAQMNSNAEVGLASKQAYLILLVERAVGVDRKSFSKRLTRDMLANVAGVVSGDPLTIQIDGRQIRLTRMRTSSQPAFEYLHGVLFEGETAIQILYWSLANLAEQARAQMPDALASIHFLDDKSIKSLRSALLEAGDPQNRVGPGFALRRGMWLDFEHGLRWTKPRGFWRFSVGEQARVFNPDASLVIEDPVAGVFGMLIVERALGHDTRSYHQLVTKRIFLDDLKPESIQLAGVAGLSTRGEKKDSGLALSYRLASVVRSGWAIQFVFWGVPKAMASSAQAVDQALSGLGMSDGLQPTEKVGQRFIDRRFGFSFVQPGADWRLKDLTPPEMKDVGAVYDFYQGTQHVMLVTICALDEGQDQDWFLKFIGETMRKRMSGLPMGKPKRSQVQLASETWERLHWSGRPVADAYLVMRDKTFYGLLTLGGGLLGDASQALTAGFGFLD